MQVVIPLNVLTISCSAGFTEPFVLCRSTAVHNDESLPHKPGETKASGRKTKHVHRGERKTSRVNWERCEAFVGQVWELSVRSLYLLYSRGSMRVLQLLAKPNTSMWGQIKTLNRSPKPRLSRSYSAFVVNLNCICNDVANIFAHIYFARCFTKFIFLFSYLEIPVEVTSTLYSFHLITDEWRREIHISLLFSSLVISLLLRYLIHTQHIWC